MIEVQSENISNICYANFDWNQKRFEHRLDVKLYLNEGPLYTESMNFGMTQIFESENNQKVAEFSGEGENLRCKSEPNYNSYFVKFNPDQSIHKVNIDSSDDLKSLFLEKSGEYCFVGKTRGLHLVTENMVRNSGWLNPDGQVLLNRANRDGVKLLDFEPLALGESYVVYATFQSPGAQAQDYEVSIPKCKVEVLEGPSSEN